MSENLQVQDCAVCLQKCDHPTQLPCGHIFCFLCVKGVTIQNRKCAMCRAEIPSDYLDHPIFLERPSSQVNPVDVQVEYQWYYEGRNGWWKYDERSNVELETAFNSGSECSLLLAGALYSIDFQNMTQIRCSDRSRRRRIRRDTPLFPAKGIAGIKTENSVTQLTTKRDDDSSINNQIEADVIDIAEDDSDDVQIIEVEPVVIQIDDVSDDLVRLSIVHHQDPEHSSEEI